MGSCLSSLQENYQSSKVDQMMSVNETSIPSTPIKEKPTIVDPSTMSFSYKSKVSPFNSVSNFPSFGGSKDETFFDTQAWLESDCEDDFYSVNGDFTPSRSSTPVHHAAGTPRLSRVFSPQVNRAVFEGKPPGRSASIRSRGGTPVHRSFSSTIQTTEAISDGVAGANSVPPGTTKSKKLADLFRESKREQSDIELLTPSPPKSANRVPSDLRNPLSSSETIPVDDCVLVKEKSAKFAHRCFPRLTSVRSFSESKKTSIPRTPTRDSKA